MVVPFYSFIGNEMTVPVAPRFSCHLIMSVFGVYLTVPMTCSVEHLCSCTFNIVVSLFVIIVGISAPLNQAFKLPALVQKVANTVALDTGAVSQEVVGGDREERTSGMCKAPRRTFCTLTLCCFFSVSQQSCWVDIIPIL